MSIPIKFEKFCSNIRIHADSVDRISTRYKAITKRLNMDFWGSYSEESHSLYVGSYGRGTDIHVSDIDILFILPSEVYKKYHSYSGNGQSALLQAVKTSLQIKYPTTHIKGDGQVIGIRWTDGIEFEIIPCFLNTSNTYTYPDTNNGGSWKTTNPKPEIEEIMNKNIEWHKNLKSLCRMCRSWKETYNIPLGGLLIDTFAYNFLKNWEYKNQSFLYYDWMTRDFFLYLSNLNGNQEYWLAPGSNQKVNRKGVFINKAKQAYNGALEAIKYEKQDMPYSANLKWKEIFGSKFTG